MPSTATADPTERQPMDDDEKLADPIGFTPKLLQSETNYP
jgi:hypothetical protein